MNADKLFAGNTGDKTKELLVIMIIIVFTLSILSLVALYSLSFLHSHQSKSSADSGLIFAKEVAPIGDEFNWQEARPYKIRPFVNKRSFNISMGLQSLKKNPEEWLLIEDTYLKNTCLKKETILKDPCHTVFLSNDRDTNVAVKELYCTVVMFMLQRYPQYFKTHDEIVHNSINGEHFPVNPDEVDSYKLLNILASNIEEDITLLLKDNHHNQEEEYIFKAGVTGFPSGFDPSVNFNKPISFIHGPVPQYEDRLKLSMSKFFNRLTSKDLWLRYNWSVQTHKSLFTTKHNHAYENDVVEPLKIEDLDFENSCFLRAERQTLTRLPISKANILVTRTYLTSLKQIKKEGLADDLYWAIEALPQEVAFYKNRGLWGDAVKQYLKL